MLRKRHARKPKRAQNAKDQVAKGHGWACGTCAKKDIVSEMTIVAERCYLCKQWRPKELADKAWEFQHSAEGAASAGRAKIGKQTKQQQSRTWTPEEWALYRETRGDREERGSVVSTLLHEGATHT